MGRSTGPGHAGLGTSQGRVALVMPAEAGIQQGEAR